MKNIDDADEAAYFANREKTERLRAEQSTSDMVAGIHTELAEHYAAKAQPRRDDGEAGPPMPNPIAQQA